MAEWWDRGSETYVNELGRHVAVGHGLRHDNCCKLVDLEGAGALISFELCDRVWESERYVLTKRDGDLTILYLSKYE